MFASYLVDIAPSKKDTAGRPQQQLESDYDTQVAMEAADSTTSHNFT
jgi:hypothetical protein